MAAPEKPENKRKKMNRREFLVGGGAALAAGAFAWALVRFRRNIEGRLMAGQALFCEFEHGCSDACFHFFVIRATVVPGRICPGHERLLAAKGDYLRGVSSGLIRIVWCMGGDEARGNLALGDSVLVFPCGLVVESPEQPVVFPTESDDRRRFFQAQV